MAKNTQPRKQHPVLKHALSVRTIALLLILSFILMVELVLWMALYPSPGICYGFTLGVPHPYHPIPCGVFPLGN